MTMGDKLHSCESTNLSDRISRRLRNHVIKIRGLALATITVATLGACSSTHNLKVDSQFPIPLVEKIPAKIGLLLDDDLRGYSYQETVQQQGEWNLSLGSAQELLFTRLASGMFSAYVKVSSASEQSLDATLKPTITGFQFSLPEQTRSNFYEVWIKYDFQLIAPSGELLAQWQLPAYGKASRKDYSNAQNGVQHAAIAACRDAMAFFALNFTKEPDVKSWLDTLTASPNPSVERSLSKSTPAIGEAS